MTSCTSWVEILSGLDAKAPAALLLQHAQTRLLLDAGAALEAGQWRGWDLPDGLDAILLSHDHIDHMGALAELAPALQRRVPIYATEPVLAAIAPALAAELELRPLPLQGTVQIGDIPVRTGLAGHSLGGVWLHFAIGAGVYYSGDFSLESRLYPFDPPPPAELALLDASYGLYDQTQAACEQALAQQIEAAAGRGVVLPVPPSGRALELALWLQARGISWSLDRPCAQALQGLLALPAEQLQSGVQAALAQLQPRINDEECQVMLAADPDGIGGEAGRLIAETVRAVIYTGYLPPKAQADVASGRAGWQRWNVHPRARDLSALSDRLRAKRVVPLFTPLTARREWQTLLGAALHPQRLIPINRGETG